MKSALYPAVQQVLEQVNRVILGKSEEIREIMTTFLANGHVLLEDIPGVGKTTIAVAFSRAMGLDYKRVQFTPDVLPSDLTGFSVYRREEERFVYQPGSVFCNLLLADEINRTSPKTQSALLEVMEERRVTVDGVTREVPAPFLVIATQNPAGTAGTQYLPDAQVDRFMVSMSIGYPDYESELSMAKGVGPEEKYKTIQPSLSGERLLEIQKEVAQGYLSDAVCKYLLQLVRATRSHPSVERGRQSPCDDCVGKNGKGLCMDGRTGLCDAGGCERAVSLCDPAQDPDERSGQNGEKVRNRLFRRSCRRRRFRRWGKDDEESCFCFSSPRGILRCGNVWKPGADGTVSDAAASDDGHVFPGHVSETQSDSDICGDASVCGERADAGLESEDVE